MSLSQVKNIIAVASGKGGVGKSTVSAQLAFAFSRLGYKTGLLDADIYGPTGPRMLGGLGLSPESNAPVKIHGISFISMASITDPGSAVVWRAPMAMKIIGQFLHQIDWGELDYLIIDCPPGTGDVQITLAQQANLTGAIIVTTPQEVAVNQAQKGLKMFTQVNVPIFGVVENMSGFFGHGGGEKLALANNVPLLGSIPLKEEFVKGGDNGIDLKDPIVDQIAQQLDKSVQLEKEKILKIVPQKVEINESGILEILWPDGHKGYHNPHTLRMNCPCARCVDENTGKRILNPSQIPLSIKVQSVGLVGQYALAPKFSDGHSSGLYKFETLKSLCECEKCANSEQVLSL